MSFYLLHYKCENKIGLFCVIDSLHKNFQMQLFNPLEGCHYAYLAERHTTITDQTQRAVLYFSCYGSVQQLLFWNLSDMQKNIDYQIISASTQCQYIKWSPILCNNWSKHFSAFRLRLTPFLVIQLKGWKVNDLSL